VSTRAKAIGAERVLVQFRVSEQGAQQVALVGDFNGWRPEHRLHLGADGVWSIDVALEPGVYNYVFLVDDGTVRLDPLAPRVTDGFGGQSSRVAVLMPSRRS
jgi:1,4-alpha-glucan branching enzyme